MDIIDSASEVEDLHRDAAIQAHRINGMQYRLCAAVIAMKGCQKLAGLLTQDARCVLIASRMQNVGIGGCDGLQQDE